MSSCRADREQNGQEKAGCSVFFHFVVVDGAVFLWAAVETQDEKDALRAPLQTCQLLT